MLLSASAHSGEETSQWQTGQIAGALPAFPRIVLKLLRTDLAKQQRKSMVKLHGSDQDVLRMQGRRMNARWMREFLVFMDGKHPQVSKDLATKRELTADIKAALNKGIGEFNEVFQATPGAKA